MGTVSIYPRHSMYAIYAYYTLGWLTGGQWGGIYNMPTLTPWHIWVLDTRAKNRQRPWPKRPRARRKPKRNRRGTPRAELAPGANANALDGAQLGLCLSEWFSSAWTWLQVFKYPRKLMKMGHDPTKNHLYHLVPTSEVRTEIPRGCILVISCPYRTNL